jgi:hypothetical protein
MVNGCPSRVMTILRMLGGNAARCGRRAERTPANSDRADRLKPNIVFPKRDSYQRRGHLTVSKVASYRLTLPRTRLTKTRPSTEAGRVVARSGVRVLGRDEVYGSQKGVSESVPPVGGGALVAAAPPRTLSRAFVFLPPIFWWGKASPESRNNNLYCAECVCFWCTWPCLDELLLE